MNLEDYKRELEERERDEEHVDWQKPIDAKRILKMFGSVLVVVLLVVVALFFVNHKGGRRRAGYSAPSSYTTRPVHEDRRCKSGYRSASGCL